MGAGTFSSRIEKIEMDNISPNATPSPDAARSPSADDGGAPGRGRAGSPTRRRFLDVLLIVSLTSNAAGLAIVAARVSRKGGMPYLLERLDLRDARPEVAPFQKEWQAWLRKLPNTEGEIIFAGDSLIAEGPWSEFYSPIKNRGIGGETTVGLLDRLDEITESKPWKVFFLVGTNCLAADLPIAQVVRNYRKILERIRRESPQTQGHVISVLPVNQRLKNGPVHDNASIRDLNRRLRDLAGEFERVTFIDVFDALADANGDLRKDLTSDGLHLNNDGYLILGRLLQGHVADGARQGRPTPVSTGSESLPSR
jgi:lysophospholipase L1-like esterase